MARSGRAPDLHLDLPYDEHDTRELKRRLNERLRDIANAIRTLSEGGTTRVVTQGGAAEIVLFVPGTLAIESDAAPLVTLGADRTFTELVALAKRAPEGAAIVAEIEVGGEAVAEVTIAADAASGLAEGSFQIGADAVVRLNVTGVGTSFPGSDLTLILR
jgi:hypothetical protein